MSQLPRLVKDDEVGTVLPPLVKDDAAGTVLPPLVKDDYRGEATKPDFRRMLTPQKPRGAAADPGV